MARGYLTSSSLIETVKREAMVPTNQSTFTEDDFLSMANQEMRIGIVPSIMQYHQEYLVRDSAPITLVANQNNYPIPYRAIGGKVRDVFYKDTNNNLRSMTRIFPDDRPYYQQTNFQNRFIYFYLQGNEIVLVPDVGANPTGSIVFSFFMRPNELVDESEVATISDIAVDTNAGTTTYTFDQIPTGWSVSNTFDLLQTRPGHKTIAFDLTSSSLDTSALTLTFTTTDVGSTAIVGDYVALAGECIIPQVPADLHDVLAQRVVMRCLQALGDQPGYTVAQQKLAEMEKYTGNLVDNRSEGEPPKINNLKGLLRTAKIRKRGWI